MSCCNAGEVVVMEGGMSESSRGAVSGSLYEVSSQSFDSSLAGSKWKEAAAEEKISRSVAEAELGMPVISITEARCAGVECCSITRLRWSLHGLVAPTELVPPPEGD
jgi:hypothetical protein